MKKELFTVTSLQLTFIAFVFSIIMLNNYCTLNANEKKIAERPHIILLSYIEDSGYFIGDFLQQNHRVFYMNEPLRAIRVATTVGDPIKYTNGKEWNTDSFTDVAVDTLRHLTRCDLRKIGVAVWKDEYIRQSKTGGLFLKCHSTLLKQNFGDQDAMNYCLEILEQFCNDSSKVVSRLTRIPLKDLEPLLVKYPNLKVAHLIPNATFVIQSQMDVDIIKPYNFRRKAFQFCRQMYYNVLVGRNLKEKYPDRILQIYFHDFQKNFIDTMKKIFNFSSLEYNSKDESDLRHFKTKRLSRTFRNPQINESIKRHFNNVCKFWTDKIEYLMPKNDPV